MDIVTTKELRQLIDHQTGPCVTIYMPTHVAGASGKQDPVRLKNLLRRAENELVTLGLRRPEALEFVEPIRQLPDDPVFWAHRDQGLALFLAEDFFRRYRLPVVFDESLAVNRRFLVNPLIPLLSGRDLFFVLALSQNQVRLLRGWKYGLQEMIVPEMPAGIREALNFDEVERGAQVHSAMRGDRGKQAAVFHGHGGERETVKVDVEQYFRLVDRALAPVLREESAPMVLVGVDYLLPIYRDVTGYGHIIHEQVAGNPEQLNAEQLHEKCWPIIRPHVEHQSRLTTARFQKFAGTGKTSDDIRQIVPAAVQGQIDSLMIDTRRPQWGSFDPQTNTVEVHESASPGDDDLADYAAVHTLLRRGTVFAVTADELPTAEPVAAIFRF
jgi:hypothetical protein